MVDVQGMIVKGMGVALGGGVRALAWKYSRAASTAGSVSLRTLGRILELNGATEFGRKNCLDGRNAIEAFRELPTTSHEDYASYIERSAAGESRLLTGDAITNFLITSGTTGAPKMIPVTKRQSRLIAVHMMTAMGYAMQERTLGPMRGPWLMLLSTPPTVKTQGGMEKGTVSNMAVSQIKPILDRMSSSPYAVMETPGVAVTRYLHFLFALRQEQLWCIIALYPSVLLSGFRSMLDRAPEFLRDLSDGTISANCQLPQERRQELAALLGKHPQRARQLEKLLHHDEFVAGKIWPKLGAILTANSGAYHFYTDQLAAHLGGVKIFSPSYTASEGVIGIGISADRRGYVVSPSASYVEFLPVDSAGAAHCAPLGMRDVEVGKIYEVILTTYTGLVRYRMGDLVEVLGWHGEAPIVDFIERRGQLLDIVGEKVTEAQVNDAFAAACAQAQARVVDFVLTIDGDTMPPRYLLLVERAAITGMTGAEKSDLINLLTIFDYELRERSLYKLVRKTGALMPMAALVLDRDSFERFNEHRVSVGASIAQLKMPHVVSDPTFAKRHFSRHVRIELPDDHLGSVSTQLY